MRFSPALTQLFAQPLMIERNALDAFRSQLESAEIPLAPARACPDDDDPAPRYARILQILTLAPAAAPLAGVENAAPAPNDTAIITIAGVIVKHAEEWECEIFGLTDLDDVDAALAQVAGDQNIGNVLLNFVNCPGGSVIGVPETAAKVRALANAKNVKTFSDSQCTSAGVFIGSQAGEFFVTASTYSGSIGTIQAPILDFSKNLAMNGISPTIIKSGKFKDTGTQLRPPTQEEIEMLQARSDRAQKLFTGAVKAARPQMSADSMQGQVFFGAEAVELGLADAVLADLSEALAQF